MGDRFGRRRVFAIGVALFGTALLLCPRLVGPEKKDEVEFSLIRTNQNKYASSALPCGSPPASAYRLIRILRRGPIIAVSQKRLFRVRRAKFRDERRS